MSSIVIQGDTVLYWIKHPDHNDIRSEGYVGISSNVNNRFKRHKFLHTNKHLANAIKKYGWKNLIKQVMLVADESYCLMIEKLLRAKENIGWNIAIGGGKPPVCKGGKPLSEETKAKISATKTGVKLTGANLERAKKQVIEIGKNTRFKKGTTMPKEWVEKNRQAKLAYWKKIKELT